MSASVASGIIDVDAFVLEPRSMWTEFLDGADRARARDALRVEQDGERVEMVLAGTPVPDALGPAEAVLHAGSAQEWVRVLDARGVQRAVLTPRCMFSGLPWVGDRHAATALARGYNAWAAGQARTLPDRLLPVAVLPPGAPALARAELRHIADAGMRAVWICPPHPADGRLLPRDFWSALLDAGLTAYVHPPLWSPPGEASSHASIAADLLARCGAGTTAAGPLGAPMDCAAFLMGLLADGVLESLPGLRLIFAGAGTAWLPLALEKTESALWLCHQDRPVCLEPEKVFAQGTHAIAFDERDGTVQRMHARFADTAAWGSGSAGGSRDARSARDSLRRAGVPEDRVRSFLGGNAARALGIAP